ncbi:hypothetical protein LTR10_012645 [Elasticomyces elasticus]|uniref:Uncharacterized protein n=1 Tax=Exophiala sideris TaxID=1016849 RepID=A0ABR0JRF8_9EURO|nr:hypothetical protein LTR10_012645 [Elasticomyces elasticus]KAK5040155.1 hypothetical protein LTS07_000652 [Exophiala sideris]KAK5043420.1 hypothetical protein LTR13_001191 [Exophiala sideris]KAK5068533.1 hypothetical protein LTR69_000653 [Exophiala sideris]KAK5186131.1 hypothetical protein LTR44_001186 [Eurotiomycetes sp. CCFEE 6388]
MAAAQRHKDMLFVLTDGNGKADPEKRKLIRKFTMLGKNRGKTRNVKPVKMKSLYDPNGSNGEHDEASGLLIKMRYSTIPRQAMSELSLTQFAATVDPPVIHDLLKFSFKAKRIMYPLERHIMFHKNNKVDTMWVELLTLDAAYMHAAVFASQAYIFHTSNQETPVAARRAVVHHSAALRLLRERLSAPKEEDKISVTDPTILVVLYLTLHAHFMVDCKTAKHHMSGLRKLVDMRGGLMAFNYNTKMVIELLKCDLSIALDNGTEPMFFNDPSEPLMPYDSTLMTTKKPESSGTKLLVKLDIDAALVQAWTYLQRFCSTITAAAEHKRQLPKEILLSAMGPVMYRLLRMKSFDTTSIDEAVRLGLLVFSSHIFLSWQGVKPRSTYLPNTYRSCLLNLKLPSALPPKILVWLLMTGALSVFHEADGPWLMPWLQGNIELCEVHDWCELRSQLQAFPWIDFLDDNLGRTIFDAAVLWQKDGGTAR